MGEGALELGVPQRNADALDAPASWHRFVTLSVLFQSQAGVLA